MSSPPLWVGSEAIQALLRRLIDRIDAAEVRGSSRVQSCILGEKLWPELFKEQFESSKETLWEHLVEMSQWGWLQVKPEEALRSRSGYAKAVRLSVADEPAVRTATGLLERKRSSAERWRASVYEGLDAPDNVKAAVANYCIEIPDRSMAEVVERLNRLESLRDKPLLLREASAQLFWGMSKVLDKRQGLVSAILGVEECPFPEVPVQLQVHIPTAWGRGVLFIENQVSFERAVSSSSAAFSGLVLAFASGFKGSAQRLRAESGCSIYYSRNGVRLGDEVDRFEEWLFKRGEEARTQVFFWGDLDYSGMRILAAMRTSFSELRAWEPGYAPMLQALAEGLGHAPGSAEKSGQRPIEKTGCSYADEVLLPSLSHRKEFVDQEQITI